MLCTVAIYSCAHEGVATNRFVATSGGSIRWRKSNANRDKGFEDKDTMTRALFLLTQLLMTAGLRLLCLKRKQTPVMRKMLFCRRASHTLIHHSLRGS